MFDGRFVDITQKDVGIYPVLATVISKENDTSYQSEYDFVSISMSGWAHKVTHAPRPFSDLLCIPICFILPVVPYL
jgi:hypothetical protein